MLAAKRHPSWHVLVLLALLMGLAPAFAQLQQGEPQRLPVDPDPLVVERLDGAEALLQIEIAHTNESRARGLMFRTDLDDDRGMLFVFEETRNVGFWMKNTPLPLDLIFIREDGIVAAILPGEPYSTASISPDEPVRFVLEVRRGIAERSGMEEGARLRHPRIDEVAGPG